MCSSDLGKLTYAAESARFDFDKDDVPTYYYGRQAMHRMMYTIANSKAMNGAMPGSIFVHETQLVAKVVKGINIVFPILIILLILLTVIRFWKKPSKNTIKVVAEAEAEADVSLEKDVVNK